MVDRLSLSELISCIAAAALVVTGDSLVMHLAAAEKVPLLTLFGPTLPTVYLPPLDNSITISAELYCAPCVHYWHSAPCAGDNRCMQSIGVEQAAAACLALLQAEAQGGTRPAQRLQAAAPAGDYYPGLIYTRPARQQA